MFMHVLEMSSYSCIKLCRYRIDVAAREMKLELEAAREKGLVLGMLEMRGGWRKAEKRR